MMVEQIKFHTGHKNARYEWKTDDVVSNTIAHAILGAVVAELQGNSALAGGLGAAYVERSAEIIAKILYPDKAIDKLSQEEKQQVSALAQLAAGLTTAALGGNAQDINTAMAGGKNAIENNYLKLSEARRKAYLSWIKPNWKGEELTEDEKRELENLEKLDKERDQVLLDTCYLGNISSSACQGLLHEAWQMQKEYAEEAARTIKYSDIYREDSKKLNEALLGLNPDNIINLVSIEAIAKETGRNVYAVAQQYRYVMAAHSIISSLAGLYGGVKLTSGIDTVTVYRVEGAPNTRVIIGDHGEVTIIGDTTLYLNFGDKARAQAFLEKRISQNMEGATIKSFEVPKSFLEQLRQQAIKENMARNPGNKDKPIIADPTKADDQYGIRPNQFDELKNSIIQGSGKDDHQK